MSNQPVGTGDIRSMIEECTTWYAYILEKLFYPRESASQKETPAFVLSWIEQTEKSSSVNTTLKQLYDDFIVQGQNCLSASKSGLLIPDHKEFKKFNILFEDLIGEMSVLESHISDLSNIIDPQTGLKTRSALHREVLIEMERLARHGKPFTMALIKINDFKNLQSDLTEAELLKCFKDLAASIQKCIRTFDDAYALGEGIFVVCLKQSGNSEGMRALTRLKNDLREKNSIYRTNSGPVVLSVSSCITEPMPGDNIDQILNDLSQDLKTYDSDREAVLEHHEISALERFLKDNTAH